MRDLRPPVGMPRDGDDDPFPFSDAQLRSQAEAEARAEERQRELAGILRRVAARTHTRQDVQRLARELDLPPTVA